MATILLDSSVIFDHLNGRFGRTEFLASLLSKGTFLPVARLTSPRCMPVSDRTKR